MGYKNLTICSRDGFGSQYLKKMYGFGFCVNVPRYRYIHTPFISIQHLSPEYVPLMNDFIGWDHQRAKIHVRFDKLHKCFPNPNCFFTDFVVDRIRANYYKNSKEEFNSEKDCIVIHIRRGDVNQHSRNRGAKRRFVENNWYVEKLKKIIAKNDDKIIIHTFGTNDVFENLKNSLINADIYERIEIRFNQEIRKVFNDMVYAKKFFMAKSSLSYIAGILNENEVFFQSGINDAQSQNPLYRWKNWEDI